MLYVLEIAKTGSFNQAAKNLYLSQPNLSRAVQSLEDELGFPIFERHRNGVTLTQRGIEFVNSTQVLYEEYLLFRDNYINRPNLKRLHLRYASMYGRLLPVEQQFLGQQVGKALSIVNLISSSTQRLIHLVATCRLDYAIIGVLQAHLQNVKQQVRAQELEYYPIGRSSVYAMVGQSNPYYAADQPIQVQRLYDSMVMLHTDLPGEISNDLGVALGLENRALGITRTNNTNLFYWMIRNTSAVGLLAMGPENFGKFFDPTGIRLLPISDCNQVMEYGWIKLRKANLSELAAASMGEMLEAYG